MPQLAVQEKTKWSLTPEAFHKLLSALDPDRERAGEKYEQIRTGLICFFEWRAASFPEDHADEAINRMTRKIDAGERLNDPLTYVYGIARMLLLEGHRQRERQVAALAQMPQPQQPVTPGEDKQLSQMRIDCLDRCLETLPEENRDLLKQYYDGEKHNKIENRKRIAERLQIPMNALRLRARRLREKLEVCVEDCVQRDGSS